MIPLSKQQCGNCRNGRPFMVRWENDKPATRPLAAHQISCCHINSLDTGAFELKNAWCSAWELHPDYYEVYGYPSEAEQLEQQRMMAFGPAHIGDPAPQAPTEFTYD